MKLVLGQVIKCALEGGAAQPEGKGTLHFARAGWTRWVPTRTLLSLPTRPKMDGHSAADMPKEPTVTLG